MAAQFRSSPGPLRFGSAAMGANIAANSAANRTDAMQQSSPQQDCATSGVEELSDGESSETSMDGCGCDSAEPKSKDARHQKQFSCCDVERIVHSALQEQETELRRQYDSVLQAKLREQFENFSQFNQDHISRSPQTSTHDYFE